MNKTKQIQWWNPFAWFGAILQSILAFFGMLPHPRTDGHENLQVADVETAEKDARKEQEAIDEIIADMTPAQIVHAFCRATVDARKGIDLTKLTDDQQDWLLRLSDADLIMLGESGEDACRRSVEAGKLMVSKAKLRPTEMESAPQILTIPEPMDEDEKRQFLKDRYDELFMAPGVPNMNPKFTPRNATLH
jgi:hypothetical protein